DQRGAHGPRLFSQRFRPSQFFFPARRGGFSRLTTGLEARLHRARRVLIFGPQPADQPRALLAGAFGVERDQPFQNLFIAQVCGPAVSLSHSRIQIVVDLSEYRYQPLLVNGTFLVGERSGGAQFFEDVVHLGDRQVWIERLLAFAVGVERFAEGADASSLLFCTYREGEFIETVYDVPRISDHGLRCNIAAAHPGGTNEEAAENLER